MSREWKPGDVAILTTGDVALVNGKGQFLLADGARYWVEDGDARLLVVIDPEDEQAVERLAANYENDPEPGLYAVNRMQAALREFASPTPPKPDEPMGLGAVVEDENGERYVRHGSADLDESVTWCNSVGVGRSWSRINAVRILSEGVQP